MKIGSAPSELSHRCIGDTFLYGVHNCLRISCEPRPSIQWLVVEGPTRVFVNNPRAVVCWNRPNNAALDAPLYDTLVGGGNTTRAAYRLHVWAVAGVRVTCLRRCECLGGDVLSLMIIGSESPRVPHWSRSVTANSLRVSPVFRRVNAKYPTHPLHTCCLKPWLAYAVMSCCGQYPPHL